MSQHVQGNQFGSPNTPLHQADEFFPSDSTLKIMDLHRDQTHVSRLDQSLVSKSIELSISDQVLCIM